MAVDRNWRKIKWIYFFFFISAYRPYKNTKGISSVWNQQVRYFQKGVQSQDPKIHKNFDTQICLFIDNLHNKGHNVIIGMDANNDVRRGKITKSLEEIGMFKTIMKFHKDKGTPATFTTNKNFKVIESIWTSPGIHILCCWFFSFHDLLGFDSNHRLIWADICNQLLYGHKPQKIFWAPAYKVKSNDPAIRVKKLTYI